MFDAAFSDIAMAFAEEYGAPYFDAELTCPGVSILDDGGSIETPANPSELPCIVQISSATTDMRGEEGFRETDMRLNVIGASVLGNCKITTEMTLCVLDGPHLGTHWSIESVTRDSAGVGWVCRGRKISCP